MTDYCIMHVLYSQKNLPLCSIFATFPIHLQGEKKTYVENNAAHSIPFLLKFEIIEKKINAELTFTLKRSWSTIGWKWHMGAGLTIFSADFKTFNLLHWTHLFTNLPLMLTVLILILLLSWSDSSLGDPARRIHEKCHCLYSKL